MFKPGCSSSAASSSSMLQTASQKDEVKYKGVRKRKWGKWVSEIRLPNSRERIWLGSYDSAEKAARAFDAALFCLRGKNAKFNFAENPPDLAGGRSLTPAEIQVVASQYANEYNHEQQMQQPREVGLINAKEDDQLQSQLMDASEDSLPISSNSDGAVQKMDTVNWSFLDLLEPNGGLPGTSSNVPDYNLMLSSLDNLHEDMYMTPHLGPKVDDSTSQHGDDQNVDENYSHQSFLWNF